MGAARLATPIGGPPGEVSKSSRSVVGNEGSLNLGATITLPVQERLSTTLLKYTYVISG
jgi:hypothetical protein